MNHLSRFPWFLCVLAACSPEAASLPEPPKLVAQRVTATVKRAAARLVHLRTEHEALVTTPEHPFATPRAGWVPAGRLVSGDQVVSARLGTSQVLSAQQAQRVEPQAVFNLTVAPSHTYLVGTDQVLVHNRKCRDLAEWDKEIEAAEGELDALQSRLLLAAAQDRSAYEAQIAQLKSRIGRLKHARVGARIRRKRMGADLEQRGLESKVASRRTALAISRNTRALDEIERLLQEVEATSDEFSPHLAELKRRRAGFMRNLNRLRKNASEDRGLAEVPFSERPVVVAEAEYESRSRALGVAQSELAALLGETPQSDAEKRSQAERRAVLEKKLERLQNQRALAEEILDGERRIAELSERLPSTDAEREQIAAERRALRSMVSKRRATQRKRDTYRRVRGDPDAYQKLLRKNRDTRRKLLRTADYVADTERPRDELELLQERLAACRQGAGSGSLAQQAEYLSEHIATLHALVEVRRERKRARDGLRSARVRRQELMSAGRSVEEVEQRIARFEQVRAAGGVRYVQLRVRARVLKVLEHMAQMDKPDPLDQARVRAFERELEAELAAGRRVGKGRLRELQQELGESELIDAEFLESIWREAEEEEAAGHEPQEAAQDEAEDADALLRELSESWGKSPSPERAGAPETGLQALQRELREERNAVEAADFALANEQASLSQTPGRPGSSQHAARAQRFAELQQQRLQLRVDWRERMQGRLDAAQQELRTRNGEGSHASLLDSQLEQRIALLEHEVQNPSF